MEKEGVREGRDIQEDRALPYISQHTPIGKAGCGYPEQSERAGEGKPVTKRMGCKKRRRHSNAFRSAFNNNRETERAGKKATMGTQMTETSDMS